MATLTLRPSGIHSNAEGVWFDPYGGASIDETPADDSDYIQSAKSDGTYGEILYTFPSSSETGAINKITIYARCKFTGTGPCGAALVPHGWTSAANSEFTANYALYSLVWGQNPEDSNNWEWSDINALKAGLVAGPTSGQVIYCSQLYVEVDYVKAYSFACASGAIVLSGTTLALMATGKIAAESGALSLLGSDVAFVKGLCASQHRPKLSFRGALGL
jgi:hypothetical protein